MCVDREVDLRALIEGFILNAKVEGLSPRSIDYYRDKLGNFLWYCQEQQLNRPRQITTVEIREFLAYLIDNEHRWDSDNPRANRPLSPRSIQHYYGVLRTFWNWLCEEGYAEENPVLRIKPPKSPKRLIKALSSEDMGELLSACDNSFEGIRDRTTLMLFLDTGLRLSELASITLEDLDLNRQIIRVIGKGSKERMVRFGAKTAKALWKYLSIRAQVNGSGDSLWLDRRGNCVNPDAITLMIKRRSKRTGIKFHAHLLRHTYAISALRNGMNPFVLQASLGHSTLDMTRRYCASLGFEDVYQAHIKASPIDCLKATKILFDGKKSAKTATDS